MLGHPWAARRSGCADEPAAPLWKNDAFFLCARWLCLAMDERSLAGPPLPNLLGERRAVVGAHVGGRSATEEQGEIGNASTRLHLARRHAPQPRDWGVIGEGGGSLRDGPGSALGTPGRIELAATEPRLAKTRAEGGSTLPLRWTGSGAEEGP